MTRIVAPALTPLEWEEGSLVRIPPRSTSLECASLEKDGTLIAWNGRGQPVEIPQSDHGAVAALLLRGMVDRRHPKALSEAVTGDVTDRSRETLRDLFQTLTSLAHPDLTLASVVPHPPQAPLLDAKFTVRPVPVCLLWTVNPAMHMTSCIGPAERFLPVLPSGQLPSIFALNEHGMNDHPMVIAHQTALTGVPIQFETNWAGLDWKVSIEPVLHIEAKRILGVVAYLTATEMLLMQKDKELGPEGFVIWSPDNRVEAMSAVAARLWRLSTEEVQALQEMEAAQVLHDIMLPRVAQPKEFLKMWHQTNTSSSLVSGLVPMVDGRTLLRVCQPMIGGKGTTVGRAVYYSDATEAVLAATPTPQLHGAVA